MREASEEEKWLQMLKQVMHLISKECEAGGLDKQNREARKSHARGELEKSLDR